MYLSASRLMKLVLTKVVFQLFYLYVHTPGMQCRCTILSQIVVLPARSYSWYAMQVYHTLPNCCSTCTFILLVCNAGVSFPAMQCWCTILSQITFSNLSGTLLHSDTITECDVIEGKPVVYVTLTGHWEP